MKKLLFFLLISVGAFAQRPALKDTIIEGKSYKIYPYVIEEQRRNHYGINIPPVIDSLPDGAYVLIEKKVFRKKKPALIRPQAFFHISGGKLTGEARYFDHNRDCFGLLIDGEKEGVWYEKHDGVVDTITYKKNKNWGLYKQYALSESGAYLRYEGYEGDSGYSKEYFSMPGHLLDEERVFRNDSALNYWKCFYPNGRLKMYAESYSYIRETGYPQFHFKEYQDSVLEYIAGKYVISSKSDEGERYGVYHDYIPIPGNARCTLYHPNGQLMGRFNPFDVYIDEGKSFKRSRLENDTIFYASGKIAKLKSIIPYNDTLSQELIQYFDVYGNLRRELRGFEKGDYLTIEYSADGKIEDKKYFAPAHLRSKDSIYLAESHENDVLFHEEYRQPGVVEYMIKEVDKQSGFSRNFSLLKSDSAMVVVDTFSLQRIKWVLYKGDSKGKQRQIPFFGFWKFSDDFDSLKMFYDNKPYNGKLKLIELSDKGLIKSGKHLIVVDQSSKDFDHDSHVTLWFEEGCLVKIKERVNDYIEFTYYIEIIHFKNHKRDGEYTEERGSLFGLIKQRKQGFYSEGKLVPPLQVWARKKGYFSKFALVTEENKKLENTGKLETNKTYYLNGQLKTIENLYYGMRMGEYVNLAINGDTLSKINYRYGRFNGSYFVKHLNEKGYFIKQGNFKNGKMFNEFTVSDENNILRVKAKIDSSSYIYHIPDNIESWPNLEFSGSLKIYYPNANLYCEGSLIYGDKKGIWKYYDIAGVLKD